MPSKFRNYLFLLKPHYFVNILLASTFFLLKEIPVVCERFFGSCEYEMREMELLLFLGCVLAVKTRRQRMHIVFLPAPADYTGPDTIAYFRGPNLEQEIERDHRITWLICFYAPWSPECVKLAEIFAKISYDYGLPNLKFGKIDASRYQDVAKKFRVDGTSWSRQLPTIVMFEGGKEKHRRPYVDHKGTVQKFFFSEKNIKDHFELNDVYNRCKLNPINKAKHPNGTQSAEEKKTQ